MGDRRLFNRVWLWLCVLLILLLGSAYAGDKTAVISAGMNLPKFTLEQCGSKKDYEYLGLKGPEAFSPADVSSKLVLIEVMSVF